MTDDERRYLLLVLLLIFSLIALLALDNMSQTEKINRISYRIEQCDSIIKIYEKYN